MNQQKRGIALVRQCPYPAIDTLKCDNFYRPKRSFGQGYVFTGVCDSVHGGGGALDFALILGGVPDFALIILGGDSSKFSGGGSFLGGVPPNFRGGGSPPEYGQRSAGTHPTGMHSCFHYLFTFE